jgi:arginase family enzyme
MQPRPVRILDFDSSLTKQQNLIQRFNPSITDLRQIGPHCRLWMNAATAAKIKRSLDPSLKASATFLGSGDFHHISSLLIRQFDEPVSVIIFDHHPDWDILPPKFGCGSWVSRILEMPNVRKVILLGVSSEDISGSGIKTANLAALKENRLEIYPYIHPPTKVFLRPVPENISFELRRHLLHRSIIWQELKNKNLNDFFSKVMQRLPTRKAYVSIDKDCLTSGYSLTNWEEGHFSLDELLLLLGLIREKLEIVGLDITGDYSPPCFTGKIKAIFSRLDHPGDYSAKGKTQETINTINEKTNIAILERLAR